MKTATVRLPLEEYNRLRDQNQNINRENGDLRRAFEWSSEAYTNLLVTVTKLYKTEKSIDGLKELLQEISSYPTSTFTYIIDNEKLTFERKHEKNNQPIQNPEGATLPSTT